LVLEKALSFIFPIELAAAMTVGALKDVIKDKKRPAFDHIPADTSVEGSYSHRRKFAGEPPQARIL